MIRKIFIAGMLLVAADPTSYAYELGTHGALTYEAYKRSVLTDDEFLKQLGVVNGENPFGQIYYDISESEAKERTRQPFEEDQTARRVPLGTRPLSIEGWLMRGAIREDDAYGEDNPQDDTFNPTLRRPLHHFYDPVYDRPLTVPGIGLLDSDIHTAPAWAFGTTNANAFAQSPAPENGRRNHFTVFDAREAEYRALTGKNKNGDDVAATKDDRNKYWATLFRALGDIVHLVQDMGQSQHMRNASQINGTHYSRSYA